MATKGFSRLMECDVGDVVRLEDVRVADYGPLEDGDVPEADEDLSMADGVWVVSERRCPDPRDLFGESSRIVLVSWGGEPHSELSIGQEHHSPNTTIGYWHSGWACSWYLVGWTAAIMPRDELAGLMVLCPRLPDDVVRHVFSFIKPCAPPTARPPP